MPIKLTETEQIESEPRGPAANSCRDEIVAMRLFEADSTASARLTKISYLKLYNRLKVRRAVDLLFQAYDASPHIVQKPVLLEHTDNKEEKSANKDEKGEVIH